MAKKIPINMAMKANKIIGLPGLSWMLSVLLIFIVGCSGGGRCDD